MILDLSDPRSPETLSALHLGGGYAVALAGNLALVAAARQGPGRDRRLRSESPRSEERPGHSRRSPGRRGLRFHRPRRRRTRGIAGRRYRESRGPEDRRRPGIRPGEATGIVLRGSSLFLADGSAGLQIVDVADPGPARPARRPRHGRDGRERRAVREHRLHRRRLRRDQGRGCRLAGRAETRPLPWSRRAMPAASPRTTSSSASAASMTAATRSSTSPSPDSPVLLSTNKYTMYNEGWRVVLCGRPGDRRRLFLGHLLHGLRRSPKAGGRGLLPDPELRRRRLRPGPLRLRGRRAFRGAGRRRGRSGPARRSSARRTSSAASRTSPSTGTSSMSRTAGRSGSIDVTDPAKPKTGKPLTFTEGIPRTLVVRGSSAYLTADNFGFYILDVSGPGRPEGRRFVQARPGSPTGWPSPGTTPTWPTATPGSTSSTSGNRKPRPRSGSIKLAGEPSGVAVRGDLAYVASGADGLIIVDIGRPDAPKVLGAAASDDYSSAVVLDGRLRLCRRRTGGRQEDRHLRPEFPTARFVLRHPGRSPESLRPGKDHPRRRHLLADPAEIIAPKRRST